MEPEVQSLRANRQELTQSALSFIFIFDTYRDEECHISIYHSLYYISSSSSVSSRVFSTMWKQFEACYSTNNITKSLSSKHKVIKIPDIFYYLNSFASLIHSKMFSGEDRSLSLLLFFIYELSLPHFQVMHLSQGSYFSTGKVITFTATDK